MRTGLSHTGEEEARKCKYTNERPSSKSPVCRNIKNQNYSDKNQFSQQDKYVQKPEYSDLLTLSPLNGYRQSISGYSSGKETENKPYRIFHPQNDQVTPFKHSYVVFDRSVVYPKGIAYPVDI